MIWIFVSEGMEAVALPSSEEVVVPSGEAAEFSGEAAESSGEAAESSAEAAVFDTEDAGLAEQSELV